MNQDDRILEARGITPAQVETQLRQLRAGFPWLRIEAPATPGNGILCPDAAARERYVKIWNDYLADGAKVVKMVPASGAASRMFKNLFAFVSGDSAEPDTPFMRDFFAGMADFPFFSILDDKCRELYGLGIKELVDARRHRDVVAALIMEQGLNYGAWPKALLPFHRHDGKLRTALEEHLAEGAQYAAGADGVVRLHFTVSTEHIPAVKALIEKAVPALEQEYGCRYDISLSVQKPSTDTVALGPDGQLYRENGEIFFRPGGHGALIENLGEIDGDVIFIKNIDNVVPDSRRASTIEYKKALGGVLVETRRQIDHWLGLLRTSLPSRPVLNEILDFLRDTLFIRVPGASAMDDLELADFLLCKLDRPLRVCGMVRNEGEPGGGPFLVYGSDGTVSPQILESTQIDPDNPATPALLKGVTHFNPVDLAVSIKDMEGDSFDLADFVDPQTGFISSKSRKGVEIKALELPGLWNGAMSDWNTIFLEVPADTFNPVKTVNDLLRPAHQS